MGWWVLGEGGTRSPVHLSPDVALRMLCGVQNHPCTQGYCILLPPHHGLGCASAPSRKPASPPDLPPPCSSPAPVLGLQDGLLAHWLLRGFSGGGIVRLHGLFLRGNTHLGFNHVGVQDFLGVWWPRGR